MGFHTFDVDRADKLDDPSRFRYCSGEELLGLVRPSSTDTVADLGSGTGFYTDVVAPHVETCYGVDLQSEMHDLYREKGVPSNVDLVTCGVSEMPFEDDALDAAFSTMTYHEYAEETALDELARVVASGGRVVTVDWTKGGGQTGGPSTDERFALGDCASAFEDYGFRVERAETRHETFVCVAVRE